MESVAQELMCHFMCHRQVSYQLCHHGAYMIQYWLHGRGCARIFLTEDQFVYFDPLQRRKIFKWENGMPYVDQVLDKIR